MPQAPFDPWIGGVMVALAVASLVTWARLLAVAGRGPWIPYASRRPVPWGPAAALLVILFVLFAVAGLLSPEDEALQLEPVHPQKAIQDLAGGMLMQVTIVGAAVALVIAASGATLHDLGLPEYVSELGRDFKIGVVAWLASLFPVYGLQVLLVVTLHQPSHHPLIEMVSDAPDPLLLVLAFFSAVIVAPVCEEVAFRLLCQGWLEKWEVTVLHRASPTMSGEPTDFRQSPDELGIDPHPAEATNTMPPSTMRPSSSVIGLPFGWLPIGVSALLFALAHIGHGPDPIPLFAFGLILGYVYQRTHRIVPCIVVHALFNSVALAALARMVWISANGE